MSSEKWTVNICLLEYLKLNKCFIHIEDVSQSLLIKVTKKHLMKLLYNFNLQISQFADFAVCRFRSLQISQFADFVSFRFAVYSKPCKSLCMPGVGVVGVHIH